VIGLEGNYHITLLTRANSESWWPLSGPFDFVVENSSGFLPA
jgi:hypothetical protein